MKTILFVDDEPAILRALRLALRKDSTRWKIILADSGEAALECLRREPVDVIVSDMRMPGMDGATLLRQAKDEFPDVVRIILSGQVDRDALVRSLLVCHQFLSKPCEGSTIRDVIERACALHELLRDPELRKVIGQIDKLPSVPTVYWELTRALADAEVSPAQIARIVEQDPVMCAKVLQLVNGSYFGETKVTTVEHAIAQLGLGILRTLVITAHLFSAAEEGTPIAGFSLKEIQEHSVVTANVARQFFEESLVAEEAFTAALLHDIGKVVLAIGMPARVAEIAALARQDGVTQLAKETEVLGVSHAVVGGYLLGLWGLPLSIVEAVAFHHTPTPDSQRGFDIAAAVYVADLLVSAHSHAVPDTAGAAGALASASLERLGVAERLTSWAAIAASEVQKHASAKLEPSAGLRGSCRPSPTSS